MKTRKNQRLALTNDKPDGFILPLVVIIGFIVSIGGITLLARSFSGLYGSVRQEQARQSRELAEAGLARTIERLNREYNYLLINCYSSSGSPPSPNDCSSTGTWSEPDLPSSICPDAKSLNNDITLSETISSFGGRYSVEYYAYRGTQFYGGTGKLKVVGERLSDDASRVLSTSAVELTFDVKPKPCDASYGAPASSSGFPGLMAKRVDLGNNDVRGKLSANVLCTDCDTELDPRDAIGAKQNAVVDGNIYIGPIELPPVPTYPKDLEPIKTPLSINESINIIGGDSSTYQNACQSDGSTTHCVISDITLNGRCDLLTLDTTSEPIHLYVSGDITISGNGSGIKHVRSTGSASNDRAKASKSTNDCPDKTSNEKGKDDRSGSSTTERSDDKKTDDKTSNKKDKDDRSDSNTTTSTTTTSTTTTSTTTTSTTTSTPSSVIAEDDDFSRVGLFGVPASRCSNDVPQRDKPQQTLRIAGVTGDYTKLFAYLPCAEVGLMGAPGGPAITGVVWAWDYDGSKSNVAELRVPDNVGDIMFESMGASFSLSIRDYVALGVNSWRSFEGLKK